MNATIGTIFSFSNIIAGVIGMYFFRQMNRIYYPFVFLVWIGIINEIVSYILLHLHLYTIINNNLYVLLEALLIIWFFHALGTLVRQKVLVVILTITAALWALETSLRGINQLSIYFRIYYSFFVVLLSINTINKLLLSEKASLLKNSAFLICIGFIIYFTLKALVNSFWLYGLTKSKEFLLHIHIILMYVNLFTNLVFALAMLWVPRKPQSILPS